MGERRARGPYAKSAGRRAEILRAAKDVIAEHGYASASLRGIAERVGLTHAGLQHYFPTKEAILTALLDQRGADDYVRGREQDAAAANGAGATFADILTSTIRAHQENPELAGLWTELMVASRGANHPAHDHFADLAEQGRAVLTERLTSLAEHGALPGGLTPAEGAVLFVAVIEGLEIQWLIDPNVDIITPLAKFTRLMDGSPPPDPHSQTRPHSEA